MLLTDITLTTGITQNAYDILFHVSHMHLIVVLRLSVLIFVIEYAAKTFFHTISLCTEYILLFHCYLFV